MNGVVNQRILATLQHSDRLRKLESAYRAYPATFYSPDLKRLYLRFFDVTAVNVHYVEVIARVEPNLGADVAEHCEAHLHKRLQAILEDVDTALDGATTLMQANGLTKEAKFLPDGLDVEVRVTSPIMRNYLKLMEKSEQLIGLLETLRIDGVITTALCDSRRGALKAQIKTFAAAARRLATQLRERVRAGRPAKTEKAAAKQVAKKSNGGAPAGPKKKKRKKRKGSAKQKPVPAPGNGQGTVAEEEIGVMETMLKRRWRNVKPPEDPRKAA
jgi:hypothetical protein